MPKNIELYFIIGALIFFYAKVFQQLSGNWLTDRREKQLLAAGKIKKTQMRKKDDPRMWMSNLSKKDTGIIMAAFALFFVGSLMRDKIIFPDASPAWFVFVTIAIVLLSFGVKL